MKKIISLMISCLLVMSAMLFAFAPQADAALFNIDFQLKSKSVYLENLDTGSPVFEKDADARNYC